MGAIEGRGKAIERGALALVTVSVLLIGIGGSLRSQQSSAAPTESMQCMDTETREDLRAAMRAGIDQAMKRQTQRMFENWLKEPSATDQPERAVHGMKNAVRVYIGARRVANSWNPPPCP